jgi:hypothetical protein
MIYLTGILFSIVFFVLFSNGSQIEDLFDTYPPDPF